MFSLSIHVFSHVILSDFYPKSWIMLDSNLATFSSNVPFKKTKMHCDLWMFSYDFAIRVFPWKPSQLPIFSLCFQLAKISNYVIFVLYNVPWCVDYKSMPLVLILEFGNQQMHACFCGKKIRQKSREFQTREKQIDATFSACFHSLAHFQKNIKDVFLDIYNMINNVQFEFSQLDFICYFNHAWTFPCF